MRASAIIDAVQGVTKKWAKQRKREEKEANARWNRVVAMRRHRHISIREAAWQVMEQAYMKASANNTLPALARQVMYAARSKVQELADRPLGNNFDQYFTQQLLPDYIEENGVDWDVVYDARGHFREPHTRREVPLGTMQVRSYLNDVQGHQVGSFKIRLPESHFPTCGPKHRFGALLFIEKEGFMPLFDAVHLAERYDLAMMSTKGMSVTACRSLIDALCKDQDIPLLILHDFDKSGFSIAGTLQRDTRRFQFSSSFEVIDLGLRIGDIEGLETERVYHRAGNHAVAENLRMNGAGEAEVEFLLSRRVELNALASDELVAFIERKLVENGISKLVPDKEVLAEAFKRARTLSTLQTEIDRLVTSAAEAAEVTMPTNLEARVESMLRDRKAMAWDSAVAAIARDEEGTA